MIEPRDSLRDCQVLVVDDDVAIQQLLIGHFLETLGITQVRFAGDGHEGLALARQSLPDLIVLDIEMPHMNGLEMLKHVRADPLLADTPVIIQTAEESTERREQMFELGATDFVLKPLSCKEFQGRVRVHLENLLHLRRLQTDLARIDQELQDAAVLQRAFLPADDQIVAMQDYYRLAISSVFEPSSKLGGDFWGVMPINDQAFGVFMCDFAGHGVSAAMNVFQLHTMMDRLPPPDPHDPASFVKAINDGLHSSLRQRHYATFLFVVIDIGADKLRFAAGATPNPMVGKRGEADLRILSGAGMPLGLTQHATYDNHEIDFPPSSFLFLYSDALTEAVVDGDGMLCEAGVAALVSNTAILSQRGAPLDSIIGTLPRRPGVSLADDLTAVWIERI